VEIGVEGGAPARMAMAAGGLELDSAGAGLNRARGWLEEVKGESRELGARRIRAGRRGDGRRDELCSGWLGVRARKEKRGGEMDEARAWDKNGVRGGQGSPARRRVESPASVVVWASTVTNSVAQ